MQTNTLPIQIATTAKGSPAVLASELHRRLGVKTRLRTWFPRMVEYGFEDGRDFYQAPKNVRLAQGGSTERLDWILSLDTAKEIAMLQRTPTGKAIRNYLIEQDKRVQSGEYLTAEQGAVLIELVGLLGFASARDKCERLHFDAWGKPQGWWQHRAQVLGYSTSDLKNAAAEAGIRYKSRKQALARLDPMELVRAAVIDLFIGLGKSTQYAQNMGKAAYLFAKQTKPLFDNDTGGGFDFKSPDQRRAIAALGSPALLAKF